MKNAILVLLTPALLLFGVANTAYADFSGPYAIGNWSLSTAHGGTIDTSSAPGSVTFQSGNDQSGEPSSQLMQIASPATGVFSFHWSYGTTDIATTWDPFGYVLDSNAFVTLVDTSNGAPLTQSGDASIPLTVGDTFSFDQFSRDSSGGTSLATGFATTTVSNFSGPVASTPPPSANVPEPGTVALLGISLLGFAASKRWGWKQ